MARELIMQFDCYLSMVVGKTASLFSASARMGAILGGAPPAVEDTWAKVGMEFGIAFQMQDDLIPYRNNGAESGKDPNSDIRNGRITLPWLVAATSASDGELVLLTRGQRMAMQGAPDIPVDAIREVIGRPASLAKCEVILERHVAAAIGALAQLNASEGVDMICEMLRGSMRRNR
jgi:geranylgeranyl pyrophosphate synthase